MQRPTILTILMLVVAILSIAGLAHQTVPMSSTYTITEMPVQTRVSYSPYLETNVLAYTTTGLGEFVYYNGGGAEYCYNEGSCYPLSSPATITTNIAFTTTLDSAYQVPETAAITHSRTVTSSTTESSTSLVPMSEALGLTDGLFGALATIVIGILIFVTIWTALKPRSGQVVKLTTVFCNNCGKQLLPESKFCNICGTKQLLPESNFCNNCEHKLLPESNFCNICGTKQP